MATEAQIAANQRNAERSTGPRTDEGKARSRANALKHGLASESADVAAGHSPEFEDRRARWAAEQNPIGEAAGWALDRAVAASLRIERCERAMDDLVETSRERAKLTWDQDREVEAATTFGRLARAPVLASRQLQTTLAGVRLLIEAWFGLALTLEAGRDWSESEASRALDLLGVALDLRDNRTLIDGPEGSDPVAYHGKLTLEELDRLEALRDEALAPLDEIEHRRAMEGDIALLSKPAALILRYERDAWKRYRESMKEVKAPTSGVIAPLRAPAPTPVVERPRPTQPSATAPAVSLEEERRALLAEAAKYLQGVNAILPSTVDDEDDAWFDAFERRIEAREGGVAPAAERTQFVDFAIGRTS
jgi:hypothetical protein